MSEEKKFIPPESAGPTAREKEVGLPPYAERWRRMLLGFENTMRQLRELTEKSKNEPAMIFATQMIDCRNFMSKNQGASPIIKDLQEEQVLQRLRDPSLEAENKKKIVNEELWLVQFHLLRADAILQSYVLPILDPPPPEVQRMADEVRKMTEELKQVMKDNFGVVFDDIQLMSPPQPESEDYEHSSMLDTWLPFAQVGGKENPEVKKILTEFYRYMRSELEKDDLRLAEDEKNGRFDRDKFDSYLKVTDVIRWGYTRDGIRECPSEVVTRHGVRSIDSNLEYYYDL